MKLYLVIGDTAYEVYDMYEISELIESWANMSCTICTHLITYDFGTYTPYGQIVNKVIKDF